MADNNQQAFGGSQQFFDPNSTVPADQKQLNPGQVFGGPDNFFDTNNIPNPEQVNKQVESKPTNEKMDFILPPSFGPEHEEATEHKSLDISHEQIFNDEGIPKAKKEPDLNIDLDSVNLNTSNDEVPQEELKNEEKIQKTDENVENEEVYNEDLEEETEQSDKSDLNIENLEVGNNEEENQLSQGNGDVEKNENIEQKNESDELLTQENKNIESEKNEDLNKEEDKEDENESESQEQEEIIQEPKIQESEQKEELDEEKEELDEEDEEDDEKEKQEEQEELDEDDLQKENVEKSDKKNSDDSVLLNKFEDLRDMIDEVYYNDDNLDSDDKIKIVGADNDKIYTLYFLETKDEENESVIITKEETNKENDEESNSVLEFIYNYDTQGLQVKVNDFVLYDEKKELSNKPNKKMLVLEKLNKFIFLVSQYIKKLEKDKEKKQELEAIFRNF